MADKNRESVKLQRIDEWRLRIPAEDGMNAEGLVFADERLEEGLRKDGSLHQVANVARLPGIVGRSMAMPDIHQGYGFPIGGVAAFDVEDGVVSPGGVGYDINCGVRLMRTDLDLEDLGKDLDTLANGLANSIPSGVGSKRSDLKLSARELAKVLESGVEWAESRGYTDASDRERIESQGCLQGADAGKVSQRAMERGRNQLGTLGAGNHFVEVGVVDEVNDSRAADLLGLQKGGITVMVHTGSRGLGHQVCDDSLKRMPKTARRYGIELADRQLACAPVDSPEGRDYLAAMSAAANFAFVNRQLITYWVRETFMRVLELSPSDLKMNLIYDVAHNMAKLETHEFEGQKRRLCIHRKGATRAFAPGHPEIPGEYRAIGQPVLIPGDMGRYSHMLVGTVHAMAETFGSTCHGAGRLMSRSKARKSARGRSIARELGDRGILVRSASRATLAEEISEAYKDVDDVVRVVEGAGLCKRVVKLRPLAVIKG